MCSSQAGQSSLYPGNISTLTKVTLTSKHEGRPASTQGIELPLRTSSGYQARRSSILQYTKPSTSIGSCSPADDSPLETPNIDHTCPPQYLCWIILLESSPVVIEGPLPPESILPLLQLPDSLVLPPSPADLWFQHYTRVLTPSVKSGPERLSRRAKVLVRPPPTLITL
jgi:hypothetical protein